MWVHPFFLAWVLPILVFLLYHTVGTRPTATLYKIILHFISLLTEQHELMISIVKNQELYSLFSFYKKLKKRRKRTMKNRNLSECFTDSSDCSVNKSNIQSFLSCIWLIFTTFIIHQQIIHIRKNSRILSKILKFQEWDFKKKNSVMIQITWQLVMKFQNHKISIS